MRLFPRNDKEASHMTSQQYNCLNKIRTTAESKKKRLSWVPRKKKNTHLMSAEKERIILLGASALNNYPIQGVGHEIMDTQATLNGLRGFI